MKPFRSGTAMYTCSRRKFIRTGISMRPWMKPLRISPEKPANGKGTEEAWVNIEEALACADEAGVWGLGMQGWY